MYFMEGRMRLIMGDLWDLCYMIAKSLPLVVSQNVSEHARARLFGHTGWFDF